MEKSDIRELRKVLKKKDSVVSWVYSIYVDSENHPASEELIPLFDMEEAERFRHLGMFARVLSPKIGQDSFPQNVTERQDALLDLAAKDHPEMDDFAAFREKLLSDYAHTDPYYATLARIVYDVPARSKDGARLEDGDTVYEAVLFTVSPASLSKPVLGFDTDHVAELSRRWQIGNPVSGFLYPSFDARMQNVSEVLVHSKAPDLEEFINSLFAVEHGEIPVGAKEQKNLFSALLGRMDVDLETCAAISENVLQKASEDDAGETLEPETAKKIAEAAGADTSQFDELYEETVGATPLSYSAIADSYVTVRTDAVTIKVPSDKAELIRSKRIDGRDYILIPADGTVTVNGAAVVAAGSEENGEDNGDAYGKY